MKIFLLLAGDYAAPAVLPQAGDAVIAVDGGIRHAARLGVVPDLWLGDFDSSDAALIAQYADVPRRTFPADKDQTDFELALDWVAQTYDEGTLHVIGSGGDEADHAFANVWVLAQSRLPVVLWQKNAVIVAAHGEFQMHFAAPSGSKVSLFATTPLHGVSTQGLRWPLRDESLAPFVARAARNEALQNEIGVGWRAGYGLVFLPEGAKDLSINS
ncbi:MAG: thiamine diphosphokinase [Cardiobacteriaceae bacterium]|nr:thiamine diphosphokinase [Cardiobacteriaceae bacterium]